MHKSTKILVAITAAFVLVVTSAISYLGYQWWLHTYAYDHPRFMLRIKQTRYYYNTDMGTETYECKGSTCYVRFGDTTLTYDCGDNPCRR